MHGLLDSRCIYSAVDSWYKMMRLPSHIFKVSADLLAEQVHPATTMDNTSLLQTIQRSASARLRLAQRLTQSYDKPKFNIHHTIVNGEKIAIREEIVFETPFCTLVHFKKENAHNLPRLLMVAPMAGHYATLLRDTVRDSLPYFDIYITDWKNARDVPISHGAFDMDAYISVLVRFF